MKLKFSIIPAVVILSFFACSLDHKNNLYIIFDRVDNLDVGSSVKIHGIDVGKVTGLKLIDTGVLVKINLSEKGQYRLAQNFLLLTR